MTIMGRSASSAPRAPRPKEISMYIGGGVIALILIILLLILIF